jgi:CubicO group peptidase (beta-lactamase class C family)
MIAVPAAQPLTSPAPRPRMLAVIDRRGFLIGGTQAAVGLSLLGGHSLRAQKRSDRALFLKSRIAEWKQGIPRWLRDARLPGVSLAIIDAGRVVWEAPFGVKDAGTGAPVRHDTVFAACSNTKPVFAYAVVKLCEKGVMDLDVPLTKYTSRRFVEGDSRLDLITARHVLTHTTGFPNWREPGKPVPIQFTPGTQRQYSGEGFRYLQSVVQEVARQPFADFMRVNVLEPFRMTSSRIVWDDKAYARRLARRHDKNGTPIVEPAKIETAAEKAEGLATYGAAAALHTTPGDYAKFLIEIVDPKPADAFRLNERSRRDYLRPQFKRDEMTSSGLGWVIGQHGALTVFNHAGSASGWYCESYASVGRKAGIVIMTNGDNFLPFREQLKLDLEFFTQLFAE